MRRERVDPGLEKTQNWMQAVILTPGGCEEAIAQAGHVDPREATGMVLPSRTLQPTERLDIYREMYEARLVEALQVDYPGLHAFLGEELFTELMLMYVRAHPSRSYTLNRLGDKLPAFVKEVEGLPRAAFVAELAALELVYSEVFDAEETPALTKEEISRVPAEAWENARLEPIAAFRTLHLRYPAQRYLAAVRDETLAPPIRKKDTHLVIYRRNYAVMSLELTRQGYEVLETLVEGKTLGEAILAGKMNTPARHKQLTKWFQTWTGEGLFRAVRY